MLDTSEDFEVCEAELGLPVEDFLTPLTRRLRKRPEGRFAIDNGAFAGFPEKDFLSLLERERSSASLCRFVVAPDVPGSAARTLELFEHWGSRIRGMGFPVAFVAQNGQENFLIPSWNRFSALFVGGLDLNDGRGDWKLSPYAEHCIKAAKMRGKWVHVGRVNTPERFDRILALGADSIDGTGISRYSHMRRAINHPNLFQEKHIENGLSSGAN